MRKYIQFILLWIVSPINSYFVYGQVDSTDIYEANMDSLSKITVSNSFTHSQEITGVPAVAIIYTSEQIQELGVRSLYDLIRITPGFVEVGDLNERNYAFRGLSKDTPNGFLILINGHRTNDLISNTSNLDRFSLEYIDRVEIIKGAATSKFGFNAEYGVINIVTKVGNQSNRGLVSARYGNGNTILANAQIGRKFSDAENIYFSLNYKQSDGLPVLQDSLRDLSVTHNEAYRPSMGGTEFVNKYYPSFEFYTCYQRYRFSVMANLERNDWGVQRTRSDYNLIIKDQEAFKRSHRADTRATVEMNFKVFYNKPNYDWVLRASFDNFGLDQDMLYHSKFPYKNYGSVYRLSGSSQRGTIESIFKTTRWGIGKQRETTIGIQGNISGQAYRLEVPQLANGIYLGTYTPDKGNRPFAGELESNISGFISHESWFWPKRMALTVHARADYHNYFSWLLSSRAALTVRFANIFRIKLMASTAALPTFPWYRQGIPAMDVMGSRQAGPEQLKSLELAIVGNTKELFSYQLIAFHNQTKQVIMPQVDSTEKRFYREVSNISTRGAELLLRVNTDIIGVFASAAYTMSFTADSISIAGSNLLNWPKWTGSSGITIRPIQGLSLTAYATSWAPIDFIIHPSVQSRSPNPDYQTAIYTIPMQFSLNSSVRFSYKQFGIGLSGYNLLNRPELLAGYTPIPQTGQPISFLVSCWFIPAPTPKQ